MSDPPSCEECQPPSDTSEALPASSDEDNTHAVLIISAVSRVPASLSCYCSSLTLCVCTQIAKGLASPKLRGCTTKLRVPPFVHHPPTLLFVRCYYLLLFLVPRPPPSELELERACAAYSKALTAKLPIDAHASGCAVRHTGLEPRTSRPQTGLYATHMYEPRLGQVLLSVSLHLTLTLTLTRCACRAAGVSDDQVGAPL